MPRRIPTLGYPSRTDAVVALRKQGRSDRQIAAAIGIEVPAVAALACSARRTKGMRATDHSRTIVVPNDILDRLRPAAARRGVAVNVLVRDLLDVIADDSLCDAILEDGSQEAAR